jgi:DNA-binding transcriptional regulator YhcF (GntR family)
MMKINVDRTLPIAIVEQIKGQMSYAIACGQLSRGEILPSVRDLSAQLQVAPVTISQVYRELARQGLVASKPGIGTFVADIVGIAGSDPLEVTHENLRQIVDNCFRQGLMLGHGVDDIQNMFRELAEQYRMTSTVRTIVMVGNFRPATESYAREIEGILHDLNVKVTPVVLEDLVPANGLRATIESAKLVITVPTRLQEVHGLIHPRHARVTAVAFRPSLETRRRISALPPNCRIGLVATYAEFLQTMMDEVASYCMTKTAPVCAVIDQPDRVRSMLGKLDVVIYASGSEKVLEWLLPNVQAIEFRHAPEPDSVNRLRPLLR